MPDRIADTVRALRATRALGVPGARKGGRNPALPYVPLIKYTDSYGIPRTKQLMGLAYATRTEATERADREIDRQYTALERKLRVPSNRALRESYNLPRLLEDIDPQVR